MHINGISKNSSDSKVFKGLSSFGSGIMGAAKEAASSAANKVDGIGASAETVTASDSTADTTNKDLPKVDDRSHVKANGFLPTSTNAINGTISKHFGKFSRYIQEQIYDRKWPEIAQMFFRGRRVSFEAHVKLDISSVGPHTCTVF